MPQPGDTFGEFVLRRELGRGAMGVVWEASQPGLGRSVALKVLGEGVGADPVWVKRFQQEAAQAARLSHPGILPVYAVGETGGRHWFAMELVEGEDLAQRLAREGPLPPDVAARLVRDAARALEHAHRHGVLHRDVKPANLMVRKDGRVAVTDFGLSKDLGSGGLTTTGLLVGTPYYMSPELVVGPSQDVGPGTDVYGLGVTLYELLTGAPPFVADTAGALLRMIAEQPPAPPRSKRADLPADLETIVLASLAKEPARRFPSAAAFADELDRFLKREPLHVRPPGPLERFQRFAARHKLALGVAAVALVLVGVTVGYFVGRLDEQEAAWQKRMDGLLEEAAQQAEAGNLDEAAALERQVVEMGRESPEAARDADAKLAREMVAALRAGRALSPFQRLRLTAWAEAVPGRLTVRTAPPEATLAGFLVSGATSAGAEPRSFEAGAHAAGLWRLHASAPGRATTMFTVLLPPASEATIDVTLPRAEEVPAGMLAYGGAWFPPERPRPGVALERMLPPYLLSASRVTGDQYAAWLQQLAPADRGRYTPEAWRRGRPPRLGGDDPVLGLTREQAEAFARAQGARLPTDHELIHATAPVPMAEIVREAKGEVGETNKAAAPGQPSPHLLRALRAAGERLAGLEGLLGWNGPEHAVGGPGPFEGRAVTWPRPPTPAGGADAQDRPARPANGKRRLPALEVDPTRVALRLAR